MRAPRRPDPEVLEFDYRIPTALGTAAWAAALVALVVFGDGFAADQRWRLGVCAVGIGLGVFAYFYIPRRTRAEAEARGTPAPNGPHGPASPAAPATASPDSPSAAAPVPGTVPTE